MRGYHNKPVEQLAGELIGGLRRLRKGYVDAVEALLQIVDPERDYPYEFVIYRITGYRGRRSIPASDPLSGQTLCEDLQHLMLDLCDSFPLRADDYNEPAYDTDSLARRFNVSTKTIQRWRKRGLTGRRLIFADGKRRIAFLESSVHWFVDSRGRQIDRSTRFTQMSDRDRKEIIRRAKRMVSFSQCTLSDVAKRIANRTHRAVETIRYTIRKHDLEHPEEAVFPYQTTPLAEKEKIAIYRCFLRGVSATVLADRYRRTRGSIYRVVNEMRARQLLNRPISYMYNPQFELPNADEIILPAMVDPFRGGAESAALRKGRIPSDLPPYLKALYDVPLLSPEAERNLFRLYNYLKYTADKLRETVDLNRIRTSTLKQIEKLLLQANGVKNRIVRANLRLVVSIAKRHVGGVQTLFELISDGNVSLMRAVEKFDYSRGHRFSTYASWAIIRNFARSVPRERYRLDRFATGNEDLLDIAASLRIYDPNEINLPELRESIEVLLSQLSPRERMILIDHYGLDEQRKPRTLDEVGKTLGLSKERVRQIEIRALKKLREIMHPQKADFLT
ncbi:MAG: sigma-70 family RNA polymerase sigma factor [Planctomycetota bacterium]